MNYIIGRQRRHLSPGDMLHKRTSNPNELISQCTYIAMGNGTRQGGVVSPLLFSIYIRDLLGAVTSSGVGCFIGDQCVNILAYADDLVLLAPSWHALQLLLNILHVQYSSVDLTCNVKKSVCMCFLPKNRNRIFSTTFPLFKVGNSDLQFVPQFKYLGHIITSNLSDNEDIQREIRSMFVRCNLLIFANFITAPD